MDAPSCILVSRFTSWNAYGLTCTPQLRHHVTCQFAHTIVLPPPVERYFVQLQQTFSNRQPHLSQPRRIISSTTTCYDIWITNWFRGVGTLYAIKFPRSFLITSTILLYFPLIPLTKRHTILQHLDRSCRWSTTTLWIDAGRHAQAQPAPK
jgi:hypothetical protein